MIVSLFLWVSRRAGRGRYSGIVLATEDGKVVITEDEKNMIDLKVVSD